MNTETNSTYPSIAQSWGIVGIAILAMIVFVPVNLFLNRIAGKELSMLIYYVLTFGTVFWFAHYRRQKVTGNGEFSLTPSSFKVVALVIIAVIAMQTGVTSPLIALIPMPDIIKSIILELSSRNGLFAFLAVVVAAPILEELIFRGVILDGLLSRYSSSKAIVISSFLFGVLHLNPWQFISAFFIGLLAGWAYYKTRSLLLPILIHFTNNLLAFIGMHFTDQKEMMEKSLPESYGGIFNLIAVIGVAWVVGGFCLYLLRIEFARERERTVQGAESTVD